MRRWILATGLLFISFNTASAEPIRIDSLTPKNKAYLNDFCNFHPASSLCYFTPNPVPRPPLTPPGGPVDPGPIGGGGPVPTPPAPPPAVCKGTGKSTTVTSAAQFQTTLNVARGGDTIVLKGGSSFGTLNINKGGTSATAPIYIAAESPAVGVDAKPLAGPRSTVSLMTINASNITICGVFFDDRSYKSIRHDKKADNLTYLQNYFNTGTASSMTVEESVDTWEGGTNLTLQSNYFNATRNSGFALDYGVAAFNYNGFYLRGNVFDGVYNHAISLKWGVNNAFIDGNVFKGCGQVCVEIGQTQDFTGSYNNTGTNATITNNTIIDAYSTHPQGRYRKGMLLRNQQNIIVRGNTFQGPFYETIRTDFMNRGGLERLKDRQLGIWNLKQNLILIENNKFSGGKLNFTGRGVGKADQINLRSNTGAFTCNVGAFVEAEGKVYAWSTIDRNPPTVTGCK